jgi:hypothetical protein
LAGHVARIGKIRNCEFAELPHAGQEAYAYIKNNKIILHLKILLGKRGRNRPKCGITT